MEKIKDIADALFKEIKDTDTFLQAYETIRFFKREMENHMHEFIKENREILPPELIDYIFRSF